MCVLDESAAALLQFKNGGMDLEMHIKQEIEDDDDDIAMDVDEDVPTFGPAALGLQRVGTPAPPKPITTPPTQVLNRRGMPARIRKKNRLFFDDELINTPHHRPPSAKKLARSTPIKKPKVNTIQQRPKEQVKTPIKRHMHSPKELKYSDSSSLPALQSPDRKIGQKIGMRLRNLLKLPKAHKWVCYEWFYSNIDRTLFSGDNDFMICLKESFPELKCRELTRIEWTKIRRMMGKPRRCSQSFFEEERSELEKKRNKIRALQQRKPADISNYKDLPPEIPLQLVIGTKVTARLRKPQDGLFTGSIDAVDTSNNTYRITFERQGLGTHSVPDYEVLSNEPPETITISSFQHKFRPRNTIPFPSTNLQSPALGATLKFKNDPLLSGTELPAKRSTNYEGTIGGFPVKLLKHMVIVNKILAVKRTKVNNLKEMNSEAERFQSFGTDMPEDFEKRYAGILIELEKLNKDLQKYLDEIQSLCHEIAPEPSVAAMLAPSHLREKCREESLDMVHRNNGAMNDKATVSNKAMLELITDLTALMLQVKSLSDSDQNAYELQVLQGTMEQIKRKLSVENQVVFQNQVEVHMQHIQLGLGQNKILKPSSSKA